MIYKTIAVQIYISISVYTSLWYYRKDSEMKDKDPGIPQTSGRVVVEQVLSSPSLLELAQTRCATHVLVDAIKRCDTIVKDAHARDAHGM